MVEPIQSHSPPVEADIVPRPAKVEPIPSHGFSVEDAVTLHNKAATGNEGSE
ncbi:hypothetical protein [Candidatus Korobacter versatilis]|uniref:hypothetical protein n=1 Tax=Candidatus Korobacter versatilis TaxID=658062 RepID=UPI0003154E20|nr:hypothetical protein [Candidatus Koribacter versatilis]